MEHPTPFLPSTPFIHDSSDFESTHIKRRVNPSRPVALLRRRGLRSSAPPRRLVLSPSNPLSSPGSLPSSSPSPSSSSSQHQQAVVLSSSSSSRGPQQSTPVALRRPQVSDSSSAHLLCSLPL
ncbi:hypothetical protein HN873_027190 [Arachis hypogaea]